MTKSARVVVCMVVLICFFLPTLAPAQQLDRGTVMVEGFGGVSSGLGPIDRFADIGAILARFDNFTAGPVTLDSGSRTKWNAGASGGVALSPRLLLTGEVVRTQLPSPRFVLSVTPISTALTLNAHLLEVTGGGQYIFRTGDSRVVPFVGGGIGMARSR